MPYGARQSRDSGHSAFTDHLIARRPAAETKRDSGQPGRLRAWREIRGPLARRNHGLASVLVGERSQSSIHLQRAYRLLSSVQDQYPDNPDVLNGLGMSLALQGKPRPALELFQKAAGRQPGNPLFHTTLAAAWWENHSPEKAAASLERAIEADPLLESAYHMLAKIYQDLGKTEQELETWGRFLKVWPRSIYARQALARLKSR